MLPFEGAAIYFMYKVFRKQNSIITINNFSLFICFLSFIFYCIFLWTIPEFVPDRSLTTLPFMYIDSNNKILK